ncbi:MAG: acyl-ACP--UDP-N-acetylglucosamine O-acyltransferase [Bacteroidales bacterium]|jgi:UDP-N-acetylglucosamine acyltransferase
MINNLSAFVHPKAKIGKNVIISPFAYIDENVEIGDDTYIGPHASIMSGARIGKQCKIYHGAVVSEIPQDLKYKGEETLAIIGDKTVVREYVTINKGTQANMETVVGKNCLIMAYAHVAHDCIIGDNCILANNATLAGHVIVEDWAILGGLVAVHQFVSIGRHSMISGGSLVRKDVPPYVKAAKEPLSYIGVNSIGLTRRGFTSEQIEAIKDVYRIIFVKHRNISNAIKEVVAELPQSEEKNFIIDFIKNSSRGIMKGYDASQPYEE